MSIFSFISPAEKAYASDYALDLSSITPPALPAHFSTISGTFATENDGVNNRIKATTANAINTLLSFDESSATTDIFTFTGSFANTAAPTTSLLYPGFSEQYGTQYKVVLSRGTGEARGALWVQRTNSPLGPTFVGVSGTTFTGGIKYNVTTAVTGGTTTKTFAVSVQRTSDSNWLKSNGTWDAAQQTALTVSDSSPLNAIGKVSLNIYSNVATDAYLYSLGFNNKQSFLFPQQNNTPVLAKGATYNGWKADALAAPAVIWDGTRYVMTVSFWSIANSKWASGFFTSPDLTTWTYVNNSLFSPSGSDYILGDSGLEWFGGKYWFVYNRNPKAGPTSFGLATSVDLLNWTTVVDPLVTPGFGPALSINPVSGKLEVWYKNGGFLMQDSPDGITWTDRGVLLPGGPLGLNNAFNEPSVFYIGNTRYIIFDGSYSGGHRIVVMVHSVNQDTTWVLDGIILDSSPAYSWKSAQVFDASPLVADLGDGYGAIPRMLYAGSDNTSGTDNTNSSIGLANLPFLVVPSISVSPVSIFKDSTNNIITVTGNSTSWTAGTPGLPTFTLSGGTGASIANQTVTDATHAILTVTAGSSTGTLTITDPSALASATITVSELPPVPPTPPTPTPTPTPADIIPAPAETTEEIIQTIHYYLNAPFVSFSVTSPRAFDSPFTFDASDSFSTRGIVKYEWDFGDGTTSEGIKVEHQYQTPGRYIVILTVTDGAGKTAIQKQTVDANPPKPTVEDISADGNDLVFKGKAYPKTIVDITIHSNPISDKTNVDENGLWNYRVANARDVLEKGDHTVSANVSYVLADQTELKSETSKTYDFKVSLDGDKLKVEMKKTRTWQYISLGLVLVIIAGFVLIRVRNKR